jgi:hypothetical protein
MNQVLAEALAAIDAANDADPTRVVWQGVAVAKARLQGERASHWLARLAPDAPEAVQLAVRGHHLRRFAIPRTTYPDGRVGYLRWRAAQKAALAEAFTATLAPVGVDAATIAAAVRLAQRTGLGTDPETQLVEDAACLVFLETDLADLRARLGTDKTVEAIRKTLTKMSDRAVALAADAAPPGPALDAVRRATQAA